MNEANLPVMFPDHTTMAARLFPEGDVCVVKVASGCLCPDNFPGILLVAVHIYDDRSSVAIGT